jgi:hypothetical protein
MEKIIKAINEEIKRLQQVRKPDAARSRGLLHFENR